MTFTVPEVWWVRLDPALGSVVPLSTSPRPSPPLLVPVGCAGRNVVAVLDQIRAVSKERLETRMGELASEHVILIEQGLREILELG